MTELKNVRNDWKYRNNNNDICRVKRLVNSRKKPIADTFENDMTSL